MAEELGRRLSRRGSAPTSARPAPTPAQREEAPARGIFARPSRRHGAIANIVMMTLAGGLVATMAIPAYAFAPSSPGTDTAHGTTASTALTRSGAQSLTVADQASTASVARDGFSATTPEEISAAKAASAAAAAAAAEARRVAAAASMTTYAAAYSGPSVSDFLAHPSYPTFSLASVYNVGLQYQGVPYVYGGSTPAGFDCSGFVMYVYAQFGISLPHSAAGQGAVGTRISLADAQPGDLVIMDGHDGIYAGNGNILHAPYEGASVRVQPIWTSSYTIVRLGI